jgi:uncharacterized membrane protein YqjE
MITRLLKLILMCLFAFYAIKVIAFKDTVTRADVAMLAVVTVLGCGWSIIEAVNRRGQK